MNRIVLPLVLVVLVFAAASFYFINHQEVLPSPLPQGHVCDPDSMVCQDGTVVKRVPPNCDFAPCPSTTATSSVEVGGRQITVTGMTICLPHRNTSGPQTMECALGLKGDDGKNYGLNDPGWKYLINLGNNKNVKVTGSLDSREDIKYDSVGVITITGLSEI